MRFNNFKEQGQSVESCNSHIINKRCYLHMKFFFYFTRFVIFEMCVPGVHVFEQRYPMVLVVRSGSIEPDMNCSDIHLYSNFLTLLERQYMMSVSVPRSIIVYTDEERNLM